MKKRTLLSIAALTLLSGWGDYLIQPQPAGAESEAGLEAPMFAGRRRHRRWYNGNNGNGGQNQMSQEQKQANMVLRKDQMSEKKHARELGRLRKRDMIKNYGGGGQTR